VREQKQVLTDLLVALSRVQASEKDVSIIQDTVKQLDELFMLVVVGNFNSGKRHASPLRSGFDPAPG
jgi:hypothetical protein